MKSSLLYFGIALLITGAVADLFSGLGTQNQKGPVQSSSAVVSSSQQNFANDPDLICNQELMISYGLEGHSKPATRLHQYCPSVTQNCCTEDDEKSTMYYWTTDSKNKIERYYELYLYSLKYILGFSIEGMLLATDQQKSSKLECKQASTDMLGMNLNPKITMEMYNAYVTSLEKMGDVRRGFFCTMCDARTQSRLRDFWASTNLFYNDRIYFSKDFCSKLVEYTIRASYFTVNYLKRYSENLATLMNCKSGATEKPTFEIAFWTRQQVKNCFYFKNKYFFFFCENYCEKFHLTRASDILDGDLLNLKKFVDHIGKYRQQVFNNPSNNILMDGMTYEENYMQDMYPQVMQDTVFFRAGSQQQVVLDKFQTDVVYIGGMDPFLPAQNSKYELVLAGEGIVKLAIAMALLAGTVLFA